VLKCTLGSERFRRRDGKLREKSEGEDAVELAKVPVEEVVPQLED